MFQVNSQTVRAFINSFQFSSVTQSCLTLCNPMERSTPSSPVHHQLLELAHIHAHQVGDAIQPSHPLSSLLPHASTFTSTRVLLMSQLLASGGQSFGASVSALVLPMKIQGWFHLGLTGSIFLLSKWLSRAFSNTIAWKHQFFGTQPSLGFNSHIHTLLQEKPQIWLYKHLSAK